MNDEAPAITRLTAVVAAAAAAMMRWPSARSSIQPPSTDPSPKPVARGGTRYFCCSSVAPVCRPMPGSSAPSEEMVAPSARYQK